MIVHPISGVHVINTKFVLIILAALFSVEVMSHQGEVFAQSENVFLHPDKFYKKFFPTLKIKPNPPDTAYIKTYPNFLSVGVHVLSPAIHIRIDSKSDKAANVDASSQLRTNIVDILGFAATYRFVSIGFAVLVNSRLHSHDDYAPSKYRTATIKYSSSAYSLQFKYLRFQGFTDINSFNKTNPDVKYVKRSDLTNKEFQFEGLYNFNWKKYSYTAPLTFSQRQIKSQAGFLLKGGVYYNQMVSDSILLTPKQQLYYDNMKDVKGIQTLSFKLAPGVGYTFVFRKRIYLSVSAFTSFDLSVYKYLSLAGEDTDGKQSFIFELDGKASLGYQSKRFFAGLRFEAERREALFQSIQINTIYSYVGVEVGYRFNTPRFIRKVYKKTMPPGM